ncbi:hypothetical protein [Thermomonospora echinospora]|nr:hypothetical protein [Thermomonospora echinospora]
MAVVAGVSTAMATGAAAAPSADGPPSLTLVAPGAGQAQKASEPCFSGGTVCHSTNPDVTLRLHSNGDTSGCTFHGTFNWGDGTSTNYNVSGGPNGKVLISRTHHYRVPGVYHGTWNAVVDSGAGCYSSSGTFQFTLDCGPTQQSGPAWTSRFPTSRAVADLGNAFESDATAFIRAMRQAGIKVTVHATYRPPQRAYLMHYSWLIAKRRINPENVPAFKPTGRQQSVDICWVRVKDGKTDLAASVAAAQSMVNAFGIDPELTVAPALTSRHTTRQAIDMSTTWSARSITIRNAAGRAVTINTTPHTALNARLIAVGATYDVIHFRPPVRDKNHWSTDGR